MQRSQARAPQSFAQGLAATGFVKSRTVRRFLHPLRLKVENEYLPGADKAEMRVAEKLLTRRGVDWNRVKLVKGWFSETLTPEFGEREKITRASLVNFDCDLYLSTAQALAFTASLIHRAAVFFFDDWGEGEHMINQRRAFAGFLEANPEIHARELPNYSWESRVFLITRETNCVLPSQARMKMQPAGV